LSFSKFVIELSEQGHRYWTSATNLGLDCDDTWGWCNTKALLANTSSKWLPGEPNSPALTRCGEIAMNSDATKIGFNDEGCEVGRYFICEVSYNFLANRYAENMIKGGFACMH